MSERSAYACEKLFLIKVSQRAAIDYIIFPCPHWYNACVFILILVFMMGKKLEKIEKLGINSLGNSLGVPKSTKTHYF